VSVLREGGILGEEEKSVGMHQGMGDKKLREERGFYVRGIKKKKGASPKNAEFPQNRPGQKRKTERKKMPQESGGGENKK